MPAPLQDFSRVIRFLFRFLRYASLIMVAVTVLVIGREVAGAFQWLSETIHPAAGWAFLVAFFGVVGWFVVPPVLRFWRVPPALVAPRRGRGRGELVEPADAALRLRYVERYLLTLSRNPEVAGNQAAVLEAHARCGALKRRIEEGLTGDGAACRDAVIAFEQDTVEPLLRPLDEKASAIIRQESMAVGISTAVSWNGTVDALIVLWRNANLVARIATLYYGRPGVRGSLIILRDVATGMFIASQMQGLVEQAGGLFGKWFGAAGSVVAGPAVDGGVNAIATMRIGYVAKARCRAFRPWTDATIGDLLKGAMREVSAQGSGVVKDILATVVKSGLHKVPQELAKKTGNLLGGLFGKGQGDQQPSPAG